MRRKVYDCIPFFRELDVLEIRLNTLAEVVDEFLITELTCTYSEQPREPVLDKHLNRFRKFPIRYEVLTPPRPDDLRLHPDHADLLWPPHAASWKIETWHRDQLGHGIQFQDDDLVLLCDTDEIPHPDAVIACFNNKQLNSDRLQLRKFCYWLNAYEAMCRRSAVAMTGICARLNALQRVRLQTIPAYDGPGGWHFSFMGDEADISTKLRSFSHHAEWGTDEQIARVLETRRQLLSPVGTPLEIVPIDDTFPEYLQRTWRTKWRGLVHEG